MDKTLPILILLICGALAQEVEETKRVRMQACIQLAHKKLDKDEPVLNEILETTVFDQEKTMNKVVADMLIKCYNEITLEQAAEVLSAGEALELAESSENLVEYDREQFKSGDEIRLTPEQLRVYEEISRELKGSQDQENVEQESVQPEVVTPLKAVEELGWYYIMFVILGFSLFFFLASKALNRQPPIPKSKLKKKAK
jgi:hypothetical protein